MTDNVFILGAGASFDAGIPLMAGFVDRMWEVAIRGKNGADLLSGEDAVIFKNAILARDELNKYHGRAAFNDRNIEDILSILTFSAMESRSTAKTHLKAITKAISRTIELSCNVKHSGKLDTIESVGPEVYRDFWRALFKWSSNGNKMPTIISFNYDLVLERSLLQGLIQREGDAYLSSNNKGISLKYFYESLEEISYELVKCRFDDYEKPGIVTGTILRQCRQQDESNNYRALELLKLHGSLNFPKKKVNIENVDITETLEEPFILPPIFNKAINQSGQKMWSIAMERLRKAKNICFVGYSLPKTDIYMQYFLKAALGPNLDLNKIFVFDPILFRNDNSTREMEDRFASCFSPQLKNRIDSRPEMRRVNPDGTFTHFTELLKRFPDTLLF